MVLDRRGTILYLNPAVDRIFGPGSSRAVGASIDVFIPEEPSERGRVGRLSRFKTRRRDGHGRDVVGIGCDGRKIPLRVRISKAVIAAKQYHLLVIQDISDHTHTLEELEVLQNRLSHIVEAAEDAIISIDDNQRITLFNYGAEKMLGYSAAEVLGRPLAILMPERFRERHAAHVARFGMNSDQIRRMGERGEIVARRRSGEEFIAEASIVKFETNGRRCFTAVLRDVSERKRREAALRDSERLFRAVFDQTFQIVAILNPDGIILSVNQTAVELGKLSASDVIGRPFAADPWWNANEESRRRAELALARAASGEIARYEASVGTAGTVSIFDFSIKPVRDEYGEVALLIAEGRDVSERAAAELALRQSEAQLRRIQRIARLHHWVWHSRAGGDWSEGYSEYSGDVEEVFGVAPSELQIGIADYVQRFVYVDDRERVVDAFRKVLEGRSDSYMLEYRIVRPDGSIRVIHEVGEAEHGEDGNVRTVTGTMQDVTELRQTEEALRRSERSLANAQRIAQIGSWEWDIASGRLEWSRETYRIFGKDPEQFDPTIDSFLLCVHPEDRDAVQAAIDQALYGGGTYSIDHRVVLEDGSIRIVHEQAEVVLGGQGPIRMNGTVQDVTRRRQEEAALRLAKEKAEVASLAKSQFLANMSHELRTPLNAIIGFSEIMANQMLGPLGSDQYVGYAADILDSGRHLLDVINDILDMSRIEAGAVKLNESDIDLKLIAASALRLIEQRADDVGVQLINRIPDGLPTVHADQRLLRQVLINLLSNAVKFTPAGGTVTLTAGVDDDGGLWLAVGDTGIGMAPEHVSVALEPFGQVECALDRRYEGTGLGLPLVKSIMELHGGTIRIDSALGVGTTVTIALPPFRRVRPAGEVLAAAAEPIAVQPRKDQSTRPRPLRTVSAR